jgi:hypothetical protein
MNAATGCPLPLSDARRERTIWTMGDAARDRGSCHRHTGALPSRVALYRVGASQGGDTPRMTSAAKVRDNSMAIR